MLVSHIKMLKMVIGNNKAIFKGWGWSVPPVQLQKSTWKAELTSILNAAFPNPVEGEDGFNSDESKSSLPRCFLNVCEWFHYRSNTSRDLNCMEARDSLYIHLLLHSSMYQISSSTYTIFGLPWNISDGNEFCEDSPAQSDSHGLHLAALQLPIPGGGSTELNAI